MPDSATTVTQSATTADPTSATPEELLSYLADPFTVSLIFGFLVIVVFAYRKFDEPTYIRNDSDPETYILPRFLALRRQYRLALLLYIGSLELCLIALSLIGPKALTAIVGETGQVVSQVHDTFPVWLALCMTGIAPMVPGLDRLELAIRHWAHQRAHIPSGVKIQADRLEASDFDFRRCQREDVQIQNLFASKDITPEDFAKPRTDIAHKWARICCVLPQLMDHSNSIAGFSYFDQNFFALYRSDLLKIQRTQSELGRRIKQWRIVGGDPPSDLTIDVDRLLRTVHVFIACAVRLKQTNEVAVDLVLRRLGFVVRDLEDSGHPRYLDAFIMSLFMLGAATLGLTLLTIFFFEMLIGQTPTDIPDKATAALQVTLNALLIHGAAIVAAVLLRARRIQRGLWRGNSTDYLLAALPAAVAAFALLIAWAFLVNANADIRADALGLFGFGPNKSTIYDPQILGFLVGLAFFFPVPFVTALFTILFIRTAHKGETLWQRVREALLQGAVTATIVFLAALMSHDFRTQIQDQARTENAPVASAVIATSPKPRPWPFFAYQSLIGMTIGSVIGFCWPHHFRRQLRFPSSKVSSKRMDLLRRMRAETVGLKEAEEWFLTPCKEIGNITPAEGVYYDGVWLKLEAFVSTEYGGSSQSRSDKQDVA
jgi:hypothetical protein